MEVEDVPQVVYQLQGLLDELVKIHDDDRLAQLCERALQLLKHLPVFESTESKRLKIAGRQLYQSGTALWNKTVALSHAGAISKQLNAHMRHVACSLVVLTNPMEPSAASTRKRVNLAAKTGRAWLDSGNPLMADTSLTLAIECCEKLQSTFPLVANETSNINTYFKVLCYKAEAAVGQEQHESARTLIRQARELLSSLDSESVYLAMLCYNFGLDEFQKGAYEPAVVWLKESYEIGRGSPNIGGDKQARTLRLLANTYLEWNDKEWWQRALNSVDLANSEHSHPAGLLLKANIFLKHNNTSERLPHVFDDVLRHPDLKIDTALATVKMAKQFNRSDLAFKGIQQLTQRFKHSPQLPQIHILHLELLLDSKRSHDAKELVESCITAHNTGDPLEEKYLKHFHLLLWEQAYREFERSEFREALSWYNYSLSLFPVGGAKDRNIAKLQRNRCSCYFELGEYEEAMEAIIQSKEHDGECSQCHFLAFRIALLTNNEQDAGESLSALADSGTDQETTGMISLAAQQAFERNCHTVAVLALEKLVERSSTPQQALTALRCLVRIKMTTLNQSSSLEKVSTLCTMVEYIDSALAKLPSLSPSSLRHTEVSWFMKVAWNLGLQCGGECHEQMVKLFTACYKLSTMLLVDSTVLNRQKTCLLMAAAAGLQVIRSGEQLEDKLTVLETVLEHVTKCRAVCKQLEVGGVKDLSDPTHSLLALYEFESKLKLGHQDMEAVIETITRLPAVEAKTYEIIAALSMKEGVSNIAIQTLKLGILRHRQSSQLDMDGNRLSKCYHSLVDLLIGSGSNTDMLSKEEAWRVLEEVLTLIDSRQDKSFFPEVEVLWFLAKAWNCGIHLYSMQQFKDAERWCSMGMNFLKHLDQLKETYHDQMSLVYTEVIQKVNSHITKLGKASLNT